MINYFEGVCPVINVPFDENERVDMEDLGRVIDFTLDAGCTSVCLFAFNSEPHKMSDTEKKETIAAFLKHLNGRAKALIGIVENSVAGCIELAQFSEANGADGIILYPPALSTPSGDALLSYFKRIADSVKLDVMIQDNPRSTGVNMSFEFLLDAYNGIENFKHLKVECPIPIRKLRKLVDMTNGEILCYSGNGGIHAIEAFLNGAAGIMPGVVASGWFVKMFRDVKEGRVDEARTDFERMLPFLWYEDQSLEFYIACEKELLKRMGVIKSATIREPACKLTDEEREELFTLYDRAVREA